MRGREAEERGRGRGQRSARALSRSPSLSLSLSLSHERRWMDVSDHSPANKHRRYTKIPQFLAQSGMRLEWVTSSRLGLHAHQHFTNDGGV